MSKENETKNKPNITVFDAVCGSGKSTQMMSKIEESDVSDKFLYIVPMIDECHRVAGTSYDKDDVYKRPLVEESKNKTSYSYDKGHKLFDRKFKHPDYFGGNKAQHLKTLMSHKENIVSTHQLFSLITTEHLLNSKDYTLVIDETINVFNPYHDLSVKETKLLFSKKLLSVADDGYTLIFNKENFGRDVLTTEGTKYQELAELCDSKQLAVIDESFLVWMLDINLIKSFKNVWVSTYLFEGSQMESFFKLHNLDYNIVKFGKSPTEFLDLIHVHGVNNNYLYNDLVKSRFSKLNVCGNSWSSLSSSHFKNDLDITETLRKNLHNYICNKQKVNKKKFRYHTTFKKYDKYISNEKYRNEWIPFNIKATNNFSECHTLAYMMNLFVQPVIKRLCNIFGYPINEEQFAISELIQWLYRSRIRNGQNISVYIPSVRMRELLICWMNEWEFNKLDIHKR